MKYFVTAEHTKGKSVSHPCQNGIYDDPANVLDFEVEVRNREDALIIGKGELEALVEDWPQCTCWKSGMLGSNDWWDSVVIHAAPLP